jgi:hypothetical protein
MNRRAQILQSLAEFRGPAEPLLAELKEHPWDWRGEPLLVLTREHFRSAMTRYLNGTLSGSQLQAWAESFEIREDVSFEKSCSDTLDEILFRLSNPEINEEISPQSIMRLQKMINECGV